MDRVQLFSASRVVIVAGKGGVGKTTVTAAAALAIARSGRRVLAVEVDGTGALRRLLKVPRSSSSPIGSPLAPDDAIRLVSIDPESALATYLAERGLGRLGSRLARTGMLALVATAIPGIRDLVVLGRLRQLADSDPSDVVLVDAPAAGHAISFLSTPRDLLQTARGGPIRHQAQVSADFLADSSSVTVSLVTSPEATPVKELIETAYSIEEDLDLCLGTIIVNAVEPNFTPVPARGHETADTEAELFLTTRIEAERRHIANLADQLALQRIELPRLDAAPGTADGLDVLASNLSENWQ